MLIFVDELDTETGSHGSHVPAEQLQGCVDELKQKFEAMNVTSRPTEAVDTISNPGLKQPNKIYCGALAKEKVFNSVDSTSDNSDASKSLESSKEKKIPPQSTRSLPLIYKVLSNPSFDDQDGYVWGYEAKCYVMHCNAHIHRIVLFNSILYRE